jgi:hypothetical protein
MAVFPRIVLKNTTDSAAVLNTAIASAGTDPVAVGEIVLRRAAGSVRLHALDSAGIPVEIGGNNSFNDLTDVDTATTPPSLNNIIIWNGTNWVPASLAVFSVNVLGDVDTVTKAPIKNQSLTWDGANWVPGVAATRIGRGDGGDFDATQTDSSFVFGVWGGGDFDTTTEDRPIELVRQGLIDGCEIVSDFTAVTMLAAQQVSIAAVATPAVATTKAVVFPPVATIGVAVAGTILEAGAYGWIEIRNPIQISIATNGNPAVVAGTDTYFQDFGIQTYRWDNDIMVDWWAE